MSRVVARSLIGLCILAAVLGSVAVIISVTDENPPAEPSPVEQLPPEFLGMMVGGVQGDAGWDGVEATGARIARLQFSWESLVQPGTGCEGAKVAEPPYDFGAMDEQIRLATIRGIRILPLIYGNICDGMQFPVVTGEEYPYWLDLIEEIVKRYGYGGSFWTDEAVWGADYWENNPGRSPLPLRTWEIWNEPNYAINSPGERVEPQMYAKTMIDAAERIRATQETLETGHSEEIDVLMGGLVTFNDAADLDRGFITPIFQDPPASGPFEYTAEEAAEAMDGVSFHPFHLRGTGNDSVLQIKQLHDLLLGNSVEDKSIWVTELGWPVGYEYQPRDPMDPLSSTITAEEQREYLLQAFTWMMSNREAYGIELAAWYNYRDTISENWDGSSGLVASDGWPRPSWCGFVWLTGAPSCGKRPAAGSTPDVDRTGDQSSSIVTYVDEDAGVSYWFRSESSGWIARSLGGEVSPGTNTTVSRDPGSGRTTIAYRRTDGRVGIWHKAGWGESWTNQTLDSDAVIAPGTSPEIARSGTIAGEDLSDLLTYRSPEGRVVFWSQFPVMGWVGPFDLGGDVAEGTSPSVTRDASQQVTEIAFQNPIGQVGLFSYAPDTGWTPGVLGTAGSVGAGASPDVARDPVSGLTVVPYRDSSGILAAHVLDPGASRWSSVSSGQPIAPDTDPAVAVDPIHGRAAIAFQNGLGGISTWQRSPAGTWGSKVRGGSVAPGTGPAIAIDHGYVDDSLELEDTLIPYTSSSGDPAGRATGLWWKRPGLPWYNRTW